MLRVFYLVLIVGAIAFVWMWKPYGESVERPPWTVFYEPPVTEETATRFADHLVEILGLNPEQERMVQVARDEDGYRLRFGWDPEVVGGDVLAGLRDRLTSFRHAGLIPNGTGMIVELRDEDFEQIREFTVDPSVRRGDWSVSFVAPVREAQATAVAEALAGTGAAGQRLYLERGGDGFRISFLLREGSLDEPTAAALKGLGAAVRAGGALGADASVTVQAVEGWFEPRRAG